jgi:hypothetical protein
MQMTPKPPSERTNVRRERRKIMMIGVPLAVLLVLALAYLGGLAVLGLLFPGPTWSLSFPGGL